MTKPPLSLESDASEPADERQFFAQQKTRKQEKTPTLGGTAEAHYHGHRDRLRTRLREQGDAALADYEILELILFRLIPRRDTKPIAKALLARFGTLAGVFGAPQHLLQEVKGVGETVALDLKLIAT
ncbi:MAG TPA: UPF0758 domain-containing protein, partial [Sinorhizobium sp.]|nr:UPF0758 domain-containing protein [Sinorhizobium sp.]